MTSCGPRFKRSLSASSRPIGQPADRESPRFAISIVAASLLFGVAPTGARAAEDVPRSGAAVEEFAAFEQVVVDAMDRLSAGGAVLAVTRDDELLFSRGIGWRDRERRTPVAPDALMRIASVTKPMTAALVKSLVRDGRLTEDASVVDLLMLSVPADGDERWSRVSVKHLLGHRGGWDRNQAFDPMFQTSRVKRDLALDGDPRPDDVVRWMLAKPLQFDPGERYAYSNFGYCLLGRIVERTTGQTYFASLRERLLEPAGIDDMGLARNAAADRPPREVEYPVDGVIVEVMDSHGGLIASAPAVARYCARYWLDGAPRDATREARFSAYGSLPGTTAIAKQMYDGRNVVVLMNGRRDDSYSSDLDQLNEQIDASLKAVR